MLHDCVAEIIPIEPDADNAAAGIASDIHTYYIRYNMMLGAVSIPYFLLVVRQRMRLQTKKDKEHEVHLRTYHCRFR
mgnify:CR=1 FL=1